SCLAISRPRSRPSSTITTTAATTRASATLPRPTSTSGAAPPSWQNEKGLNDRPSPTVVCNTSCRPPDLTQPMRQSLPYFASPVVSKTLTTDILHEATKVFNFYRNLTTRNRLLYLGGTLIGITVLGFVAGMLGAQLEPELSTRKLVLAT